MDIRPDDPRRPEVARFLREHLDDMAVHSPPESIHALDVDGLCRPNVTFWTASNGSELLGCGALLEHDAAHGEIKSMRTAPGYLRKGIGSRMLEHIIAEAKRRTYLRLSLETGSMAAYAAARALYTSYGFELCEPFASYVPDPNSVFMTLRL